MGNTLKWMLSSDQQIPFHDKRAIDLWFKVMKWWKPDVIDYCGDQSDQLCFSRFNDDTTTEFLNSINNGPKDPMLPFVVENERAVRELYEQTRKMRPDADMFVALGNHDIRVFNYIDKRVPEILDQVTPEALWGLDSLGIKYIHYDDVPAHRYGDIYVHHGISISKHAGESVRNDVNQLGVSLIRGHSHRIGTYYKTYELRNETLRGYEIGHMCKVDSSGFKYTQVHDWQLGFAIAHIESGCERTIDGYYPHVQLIEITPDYTCVVDGKLFNG